MSCSGGDFELAKDACEPVRELQVLHEARRKIHGSGEIEAALPPVADLADRVREHEIGDTDDEARLFRQRQEFAGIEQAEARMAPAHQRFRAAYLPVAAGAHDFGLVMHDQLVLFDAAAQLLDGNARAGFQVPCQQAFDLLEHHRLLQGAEHFQSERVAELARARQHPLVHTARQQNTGGNSLTSQVAQRLDAVHVGHLQVQQDQRRLPAAQLLAKARSGVGGDHVAADPLADLLDQLEEVGLVVDRQ